MAAWQAENEHGGIEVGLVRIVHAMAEKGLGRQHGVTRAIDDFVQKKLQSARCMVLLDAWDEVPLQPERSNLDARAQHTQPFSPVELRPYANASAPPCQQEALQRRKIMRRARSSTQRLFLLAELESRYLNTS